MKKIVKIEKVFCDICGKEVIQGSQCDLCGKDLCRTHIIELYIQKPALGQAFHPILTVDEKCLKALIPSWKTRKK